MNIIKLLTEYKNDPNFVQFFIKNIDFSEKSTQTNNHKDDISDIARNLLIDNFSEEEASVFINDTWFNHTDNNNLGLKLIYSNKFELYNNLIKYAEHTITRTAINSNFLNNIEKSIIKPITNLLNIDSSNQEQYLHTLANAVELGINIRMLYLQENYKISSIQKEIEHLNEIKKLSFFEKAYYVKSHNNDYSHSSRTNKPEEIDFFEKLAKIENINIDIVKQGLNMLKKANKLSYLTETETMYEHTVSHCFFNNPHIYTTILSYLPVKKHDYINLEVMTYTYEQLSRYGEQSISLPKHIQNNVLEILKKANIENLNNKNEIILDFLYFLSKDELTKINKKDAYMSLFNALDIIPSQTDIIKQSLLELKQLLNTEERSPKSNPKTNYYKNIDASLTTFLFNIDKLLNVLNFNTTKQSTSQSISTQQLNNIVQFLIRHHNSIGLKNQTYKDNFDIEDVYHKLKPSVESFLSIVEQNNLKYVVNVPLGQKNKFKI